MAPFTLSRATVRELDRRAIHEYGVPGVVLMENAGRGAAELLVRLDYERERVLILCGPGNNGGDGFVMARHLENAGLRVTVMLFLPTTAVDLAGDAAVNYQTWIRSGHSAPPIRGQLTDYLRRVVLEDIALQRGWIVDALFGTGLARPLGPPFDEVVSAVNASRRPVLAVDIPSGLDCDTGEPLGPTVRATHTATFVAPKLGFANPNARPWLGEVHVLDIGAPKKLVDEYRDSRSKA
jgi:NAD(P)H-hydrate epimerase